MLFGAVRSAVTSEAGGNGARDGCERPAASRRLLDVVARGVGAYRPVETHLRIPRGRLQAGRCGGNSRASAVPFSISTGIAARASGEANAGQRGSPQKYS